MTSGTLELQLRLRAAGSYAVWLGGAVRGRAAVSVDGQAVGDARHRLGYGSSYLELGTIALSAGTHGLRLRYDDGGIHPGSEQVPTSDARSLCGKELDWVEAVAPG
jgi:hypothetical protein